ncbi:PAS domain S-box protein [Myxococcota bacterium]|nr:PAS domain S-box protein [Myxococcota bacterium]
MAVQREDLIDALEVGILVHIDGRVVEINRWLSQRLGRHPSQLIGADAMILRRDPQLIALAQLLEDDLETLTLNLDEGHLEAKARRGVWREAEAWIVTLIDVSASARAARALVQEQRRSARLIETATDAIITVDAAQRITLFNQQAAHVFGWSPEQIMGRHLGILLPPEHQHDHARLVEAYHREAIPFRRMSRARAVWGRRRDGGLFPAEVSISLSDDRMMAVIRDRTGDLRASRLRRAIEEATSGFKGDAFFERLLSSFVTSFGTGRVFLSARGDATRRLWRSWAPPTEAPLALRGSFLARAESERLVSAAGRLSAQFPQDAWLFEGLPAASALAVSAEVEGLQVVAGLFDAQPLTEEIHLELVLRFMAWRAAHELREEISRAALARREARLRAHLTLNPAPLLWWRRGSEGFRLTDLNDAARAHLSGVEPRRGASPAQLLADPTLDALLDEALERGVAWREASGQRAARGAGAEVLLALPYGDTPPPPPQPPVELSSPMATSIWGWSDGALRLVAFNAAAARGFHQARLLGEPMEALLADAPRHREALRRARRGQITQSLEDGPQGLSLLLAYPQAGALADKRVVLQTTPLGVDQPPRALRPQPSFAHQQGVGASAWGASYPCAAFEANAEGAWIWASSSLCARLKLSEPEALGFGWQAALAPTTYAWLALAWAQAISEGARFRDELQLNSGRWILLEADPRWAGGRLLGYGGHVIDVTEWHQTRAALLEVQTSLNEAQRLARLGNWDWDIRLGTLWWSDEVYRIFALSSEGFAASYEAFLTHIADYDRPRVEAAVAAALEGKPYQIEHDIVQPSGLVRRVREIGEVQRDEAGRPTRMLGTVQDITEQHALELELRQRHKMEALGRLAAGVAHDFNNLLTVISGGLESMALMESDNQALREDLDDAMEATLRASKMTRKLLSFSHQSTLSLKPTCLNTLITHNRRVMARSLQGVDLIFDLHEGLEEALADESELERVLLNLVINARDAMAGRGRIWIRTRRLSAGARRCRLEVSDDGPGIPPAVLPKIFEPFFTTKGEGEGTGLGLATVHRIVQQSGGLIAVESVEGEGTTFRIDLRLAADGPLEE